jgi:hypothetical protein
MEVGEGFLAVSVEVVKPWRLSERSLPEETPQILALACRKRRPGEQRLLHRYQFQRCTVLNQPVSRSLEVDWPVWRGCAVERPGRRLGNTPSPIVLTRGRARKQHGTDGDESCVARVV